VEFAPFGAKPGVALPWDRASEAARPGIPATRALQAAIDPSGEGNAASLARMGGRTVPWFIAVDGESARQTGRFA
jgi:hypothetical protein